MNQNGGTSPDDTQSLVNGAIAIVAWRLSPPTSTHDIAIGFNVPADFGAGTTQVIVHFDTENRPTTTTGNVTIQLGALFTPVGGTIATPFTNYVQTVSVTSSPSNTSYNHYDAVFTLDQTIGPEYFAVLNVTRNSAGDTYSQPVGLLSIEFRYPVA